MIDINAQGIMRLAGLISQDARANELYEARRHTYVVNVTLSNDSLGDVRVPWLRCNLEVAILFWFLLTINITHKYK